MSEKTFKYRSLKGWKYELLEPMSYKIKLLNTMSSKNNYIVILNNLLLVKERYAWDGPSGPTIDTKTFMRGSLFHDALCQLIGEGLLDKKYRKYADQLLRKIILEDGMNPFRAWYIYMAVRAWSKFKGM